MRDCKFCKKVRNTIKSTTNNIIQNTLLTRALKDKAPRMINRNINLIKSGKIKR